MEERALGGATWARTRLGAFFQVGGKARRVLTKKYKKTPGEQTYHPLLRGVIRSSQPEALEMYCRAFFGFDQEKISGQNGSITNL